MNRLRGYSSPFNLGHKALKGFWNGTVYASEKVDGSQFSFGLTDEGLFCRSRKQQIDLDNPGMFELGVATVRDLADQNLLASGWTYRGEYLSKPKHNTMTYDRVPRGNIILFDIDRGDQDYVTPSGVVDIAANIDLEAVRLIATYFSKPQLEHVTALLEAESVLGGGKIEGVVLKNYSMFGRDKKVVMAKVVSEVFREKHSKSWKVRNPGQRDFVRTLTEGFATEARWMKAVQHLREAGELQGIPQDIPLVMREIIRDVEEDLADEIRDALYTHFWPQIKRGLNKGAAEWYKRLLAEEGME